MDLPTINQTMNNIANSTDLEQYGMGFAISDTMIICATVLIVAVFLYLLLKSYINKSCSGCKRLKNCEKEIKEIKENLKAGKYLDFDVLENISDKLDNIKEELENG